MLYDEYLKCAYKHLLACQELQNSYNNQELSEYVWLELYYLSGYIIEGIVVYSAYKLNDWESTVDIDSYDEEFTRRTNLDFYNKRMVNGSVPNVCENRNPRLCIQGHNFQSIVRSLLEGHPAMSNVPYIGDGYIDEDIRRLIDIWDPTVRYTYDCTNFRRSRRQRLSLRLNHDVIERLINTCRSIYSNISYI